MSPAWGGSGNPNGVPRSIGRSWIRRGGLLLATVAVASLALVLVAASVVALGAAADRRVSEGPPPALLLARPPTRSVIDAADGSVLAVLHRDQDRTVVPLAAIPVRVRQAVLAIEDARFYQHGALDLRGIARALVTDARSDQLRQGGSTITQQYVKTVVTGDQVNLHRKLVEAVYAAQLARRLTKDQILAAYLNKIYFGDGVYGIATAAEHYFSKPVGRLDLADAWLVLGPLEAVIGSRRLLTIGALGHLLPTVLADLCWLAWAGPGGSLAGLDVGTSAVIVTAAAALATSTRSLPVAVVLTAGLAIDLALAPNLATIEHPVAAAIGAGGALVLWSARWPQWRLDPTRARLAASAVPSRACGTARLRPRPRP